MGTVLTVAEGVLAAGFIAQGVAEAVIKAQIQSLLEKHEEEFKLMRELNDFVEKILTQNNLIAQLDANVLFAADNWNTIFSDLTEKNYLLREILESFPKVKPTDYNFTWTNGLTFSLSLVALGFVAYSAISGSKKPKISKDSAGFKEFYKNSSSKIRGAGPQIKGRSVNANGIIQKTSFGTNPEMIPSSNRTSNVDKIKKQEKSGMKSKVITGVRVVFVGLAVLGFAKGVMNLIKLKQQLDKYRELFKDQGAFQEAEEGVLELMKYVASDIFNLANCSRAAFYDCKNIFLVKSIIMASQQEKLLQFAKSADADSVGLTQQFVSNSDELNESCNQVAKSGKSNKQKLEEFKSIFSKFFKNNSPETVFMNVSIKLSKMMGDYSLISKSLNHEEKNVNQFLRRVQMNFIDKRGKNFNEKSMQDKIKADRKVMENSFDDYKFIFDLDNDEQLEDINSETKSILFQVITSLADEFYYDDPTGLTLFDRRISQVKQDYDYDQLLNRESSRANIIPVCRSDKEKEQKEIQSWINLAKEENKKQGYDNWSEEKALIPLHRFIRLEAEDFKTPKGDVISTLGSYEGILFKVQGSMFKLEKHVVKGTLKIQKAS